MTPTVQFRHVVVPVTHVGRIGGEYEVMVDVPSRLGRKDIETALAAALPAI